MPITDALKTAADLRKVGFTEEQAAILAEKYEETAQAQSQDLKDFIRAEIQGGRAELRAETADLRMGIRGVRGEIRAEMADLRAEFHSALRDQLLKIVTILIAVVSLAVAIIKLFPDLN